ncbi:glutamate receptor-interacting protein 1 [Cloeon dipterum]|uniref:glutamate receptor-interacting protein 1 n=1 Tax=Cloeon dipterum TaxID=197152 RepID=UPI00321FD8D5
MASSSNSSEWASKPSWVSSASEHSLPRRVLRAMRRWNPRSCRALPSIGNQQESAVPANSPLDLDKKIGAICTRKVEVAMHRDEDGNLGFNLRYGPKSNDLAERKALVITKVKPGGPAFRSGCIRIGDRLVAVEGVSLQGMSLQKAQETLRSKEGFSLTKLTLEVDVVQPAVRTLSRKGPILVELHKMGGDHSLGISMCADKGIVIAAIQPGSVAYRSGTLHVGDQIIAVNGCEVNSETEVLHLIGTSPTVFHMEVMPGRREGSAKSLKPPSSPTSSNYRLGSTSTLNSSIGTLKSNKFTKSESTLTLHERSLRSRSHSHNSVSHLETLAVTLHTASQPCGITLEGSWPPVIADIEPGSAADLCGCLQPGDRILIINQTRCDCLAGSEASALLSQSSPILKLHIQFEVLEAVVPSSGVFYVKLARSGTSDLGISVSPMKMPGNAPIISKIRRGSVAHRSGALQCGDQLLEICGSRPGTQEEVIRVLQLATRQEVISLKILKCVRSRSSFANNNQLMEKNTQVYTVDLIRMGGPLGLTISGAEQRDMPITISAMKTGGLADSTGQLSVGDKLLSINGYNLNGCKLSEAYEILQNAKDTVTLQVARSDMSSAASVRTLGLSTCSTSWKSSTESDLSTMEQSEDGDCVLHSLNGRAEFKSKLTNSSSQGSIATSSCLSDVNKVTLYKDNVYEDFGFSISDGLYNKGVYVNRIREGGPADKILQHFDRILQVNKINTQDYDCCLTVPIIAKAGDKIELVIARNPFAMVLNKTEEDEWVADKPNSMP